MGFSNSWEEIHKPWNWFDKENKSNVNAADRSIDRWAPAWQGQFFANDPSRTDFMNVSRSRQADQRKGGVSYSDAFGSSVPGHLFGASETALPYGLATLNRILLNEGRTDPAAFNRDLLANTRNTEAQQQAVRGSAAARGMQNSGVNNAIEAAVGAAGADREAGMRANETRLAEQRKRDDLNLLLSFFVQPGTDFAALSAGQYSDKANRKSQSDSAKMGAFGQLLAGLAQSFNPDSYNAGRESTS